MMMMIIDLSANIVYTVVKDDKQQTARRFFSCTLLIFLYLFKYLCSPLVIQGVPEKMCQTSGEFSLS